MSSKPVLKLDWCSYEAAKYAVMHWHYSRRMPKSKLCRIGVWENYRFVGVVLYGVGSGRSTSGKAYGLRTRFDIAELVRVALREHQTPTSRIVAISIRMIAKASSGLKLLVSFADTEQGHEGTIYQASGWVYAGDFASDNSEYLVRGQRVRSRTLYSRYGKGGQSISWLREHVDPLAKPLKLPPKRRYLYPLNDEIRKVVEKLRKPYPKKCAGSIASDATANHAVEGGATPTSALFHIT